MSDNAPEALKKLEPHEVQTMKSEIAAMLNYTKQGSAPVTMNDEIRRKLSDDDVRAMKERVSRYFDTR